MKRAIVLLSGGQDSTTCLFWAKQRYDEVKAIGFNYGQKHDLELQCARDICNDTGTEFRVLDLSLLNQLAPNSLTRHDQVIEAKEGCLPSTFVDGRNQLFLTLAAISAKQFGIKDLVTGVCQTDFSGYPDCRDIFIKSLNVTLNLAMDYPFVIHTPLMWLTKAQTWQMAWDIGVLDVIRHKTLTCYNGIIGDGCGICPACKLRKKGFKEYVEEQIELTNR